MAVQTWTVQHGPNDRTEVFLRTEEGRITKFVVQYLALIDRWTPIVRYDTAHGSPHRDVMHADGSKDTVRLRHYDLEGAFEFALSDTNNNWPAYRERYERERTNEQR